VLTPGRYVGLPEEEDDFDFEERVKKLTAELKEQMEESVKLDERIKENLKKVGIEL
jgi:type I restriction enzyme M protein